jgi:iron(III) transport system ATP-binding protein
MMTETSEKGSAAHSSGNGRSWRWGQRGTAGAAIPARLTFENISHSYGSVRAVHNLSMDVSPGEIVALLGQSGCGKTTLLRIAAGIERQTGGRVSLDNRSVADAQIFEPPERRGIGLVFQDYALFPHLTILQNVAFGLRRLAKPEALRAANAALTRVGLSHLAENFPHHLSGGQQQRAALARAIAPRPRVLLMDEPFSGLDKRLRDSVRDETLAVLRETRATSLFVTHDPEEALRMADRIALMRHGSLVQLDRPEVLYRNPVSLFAARFFSEVNEIEGTVRDGVAETPLGRVPADGVADGSAVVAVRYSGLMLRPGGEGVPWRVIRSRFLGEIDDVEVVVEGVECTLRARQRGGRLAPGTDVGVTIDVRDVLVFPASEP